MTEHIWDAARDVLARLAADRARRGRIVTIASPEEARSSPEATANDIRAMVAEMDLRARAIAS